MYEQSIDTLSKVTSSYMPATKKEGLDPLESNSPLDHLG